LVYHGTYSYPPNLEAIRILVNEILPRLNARGLPAAVLAVGPNPPDWDLHPDVVFVGGVDAVAPYIKSADIAVVPLQQGGGTRMKVLDYFAAAVPVVSTSKGVEGLGLADGEQVLIRDGHDEIADAVACLIRDEARAKALGAAGRRYVEQFDWLNIARRYVGLLDPIARRIEKTANEAQPHPGISS
jgi:glycosyltransferase involved in cell wall biosynthesis